MISVSETRSPLSLATLSSAIARGVSAAIRAPPSLPGKPRRASPAATQPFRASVPHNTANTANRCGLIAPSPRHLVEAPLEPGWTGTKRSYYRIKVWPRAVRKRQALILSQCVAGIQLGPQLVGRAKRSVPALDRRARRIRLPPPLYLQHASNLVRARTSAAESD